MGDDTPDNVDEVGRSADDKPAGAEGGGNEDKNEEKNKMTSWPPVEEKKKSKIQSINWRTAQLMTLVRS